MLNDELKRRMTSNQGGLTPRVQRKGELCCVVIRAIVELGIRRGVFYYRFVHLAVNKGDVD